jgi:hypothetical protein
MMDVSRNASIALLVGSMLGGFACGGGGGEEGTTIDASSPRVQEIVEDNSKSHTDEFDRAREFLADSGTFGQLAEGTDTRYRTCLEHGFRKEWSGLGDVYCERWGDPLEEGVRGDLDELLGELDAHFFTEANVASVDGSVMTYQLDGPTVCDSPRSSACAEDVDASEIEIEVQLTGEDSLRADLDVGPEPIAPATMRLSPERWSVQLRLGEVRGALEHVADKTDTRLNLPETMTGTTRLTWRMPEEGSAGLRWQVESPVEIRTETFGLSVASADPAVRASVDRGAEEAELQVGLNNASSSWRGSAADDWYELSAGAVGAVASIADADRSAELRDIHVGNEEATMTLGDTVVGSFKMTPGEGDAFGATIEWTDDELDVRVEPTFEVRLDMKFKRVADRIEDVAEWARDSVTRVAAQGAEASSGRFIGRSGQRGVWKSMEGTTVIESEGSPSFRHEVGAGRCLAGTSGSGSGHPLSSYEVINCAQNP